LFIDLTYSSKEVESIKEIKFDGLPNEPGGINGGLLQRSIYTQQVTSIFIKVKSIDNTIDKVEKNGGKLVHNKIPIADFAYFAQINDTERNLIRLWKDII